MKKLVLTAAILSIGFNTWALVEAPVINGFTPAAGVSTQVITITGKNFSATPASNVVQIGGAAATVVSASAEVLTVQVPAGIPSSKPGIDNPVTISVDGQMVKADASFKTYSHDSSDYLQLRSFLLKPSARGDNTTNGECLPYGNRLLMDMKFNIDDPATWRVYFDDANRLNMVVWDNLIDFEILAKQPAGKVDPSIKADLKKPKQPGLAGDLVLQNCTHLQSVNISGQDISSLDLTNGPNYVLFVLANQGTLKTITLSKSRGWNKSKAKRLIKYSGIEYGCIQRDGSVPVVNIQ